MKAQLDESGVTIVIHGLKGGGAEKNAVYLANYWAEHKRSVSFIAFDISCNDSLLASGIQKISLDSIILAGFSRSLWGKEEENVTKLKVALAQAGNKKVIVFMAKMGLRCLLANSSSLYDVYVAERCYPPYTLITEFDKYLRKLLYPQARKILLQAGGQSRKWIEENIAGCDFEVIPNFIRKKTLEFIAQIEPLKTEQSYILCCGRLVEQKRHDVLLKIFSRIVSLKPGLDLRLKIVGEGEKADELRIQAENEGIASRVDFLGWRDDVFAFIKSADCVVLTSDYEGFPTILLESLSAGVPVVSFDCPTGPSEMIIHGENGFLVTLGDIAGFADAVCRICSDNELRSYLAAAARKVAEKFAEEKVMQLWERSVFDG